MNKNSIIAILAALVVLMVVTLIVTDFRRQKGGEQKGEEKKIDESSEVSNGANANADKNANTNTNTNEEKNPPVTTSEPGRLNTTNGVSDRGVDEKRLIEFNNARLSRKSRKHGKERRRVTERAVANLPKKDCVRMFENTFAVTGGCDWDGLAHKNESKFLFDAVLTAKSEIEDAKILPGGEIRIVETRTIDEAKEKLIITDASLKINLQSSPIDQIDTIAKTVAAVSTAVAGALTPIPQASAVAGRIAAGAGAVCAGIKIARQFDGYDLSSMIGKENMIRLQQAFVDNKVKSIKTLLRAVEGKSYRVIYTQEPAPSKKYMQVTWEHVDGTPLTYDEDFILSKANIFIDADILPDSGEEPPVGKEWEVSAEEVASMFCYDDKMTCNGSVKVTRKANRPNGDWYLEVGRNQKVAVRNIENRTTGSVTIKEGDATLDPKSPHQTKTLQVVSSGTAMEFTPQTLLWFLSYDTKRGADCQFKGVLRTYMEE